MTMPERIWLYSASENRPYATQGPLTELPEYVGYVLASTHARTVEALREALADAIRRPMGVIPDSAVGLVTAADLDAAEARRSPSLATSTPTYERSRAMSVIDEIAAERRRQIAKGWTPEHDDQHAFREILSADWGVAKRVRMAIRKPDRRLLIEAAALIVAEIERMDRAPANPSASTVPPQHPELAYFEDGLRGAIDAIYRAEAQFAQTSEKEDWIETLRARHAFRDEAKPFAVLVILDELERLRGSTGASHD